MFESANQAYHYAAFGSFESFRIGKSSFSVVVVAGQNEMEPRSPSRESVLLRAAAKLLVPGGVMVAHIRTWLPDDALDVLERQFSDVSIWASARPSARSRIVLGVRKPASSKDPMARDRMVLMDAAPSLPPGDGKPTYKVPGGTMEVATFIGDAISDCQAERYLTMSSAYEALDKRCQKWRAVESRIGRPPCELHKGHIAMLLVAGQLDGAIGEGPDAHVVLGSVKRAERIEDVTEEGEEESGESAVISESRVLTFDSTVKILTKQGEMITFGEGEGTDTPAL
jgi:hypothetical protein